MGERRFNLSNYPLAWPDGWARTPQRKVRDGRFLRNKQIPSIMEGLNRVLRELASMGVKRDDVLVSTNVPTRLDRMPRSDQREPNDSGVAVYWRTKQNDPMKCIAIDLYNRVADNLCAVAATFDAMRAIERHGGAQVQERTFRGFTALTDGTSRPWRAVLGFNPDAVVSVSAVDDRFTELAKIHHPDKGGDTTRFQEISEARRAARIELTN